MAIDIELFPCLSDNYGFLVRDRASGKVAAIDAPEAGPYIARLDQLGWGLDLILNTHWHPDHTDGNVELKERYGATVVAPEEVVRVTPVDRVVGDGDTVQLGETRFAVLDTGGHTSGHISFVSEHDRVAFVGDTLFTLGCGRMFEGTPPQFAASLGKLAGLPDDTVVYGAHEYTASNLRFARSVDDGPALAARAPQLAARIAAGEPTVPTTIGEEKATNPFLRARSLPIAAGASDAADAFRIVREAKDNFQG